MLLSLKIITHKTHHKPHPADIYSPKTVQTPHADAICRLQAVQTSLVTLVLSISTASKLCKPHPDATQLSLESITRTRVAINPPTLVLSARTAPKLCLHRLALESFGELESAAQEAPAEWTVGIGSANRHEVFVQVVNERYSSRDRHLWGKGEKQETKSDVRSDGACYY